MTGSVNLSPEATFFEGPVLEVAPRLLNAVLRHTTEDGSVAVRIAEVEAYAGPDDPGSHAGRGPTPRSAIMFGPAGRLYVYFTYGMHHCANVVCGPESQASAVLLRAGEVVEGVELAQQRRTASADRQLAVRDLARGPGRLCAALGISMAENGTDLVGSRIGHVTLTLAARAVSAEQISTGPRVGLRLAADRPWRFWIAGDPTVSAYRPAAVGTSKPSPANRTAPSR